MNHSNLKSFQNLSTTGVEPNNKLLNSPWAAVKPANKHLNLQIATCVQADGNHQTIEQK